VKIKIGHLLRSLRRRSRRHPTPRQAFDALSQGVCMYAPISTCSGPAFHEGLRGDDDVNDVLVCKAHFGRLRRMPARDLDRLERTLVRAFAEARGQRDRVVERSF
jgi:hypothetical protein